MQPRLTLFPRPQTEGADDERHLKAVLGPGYSLGMLAPACGFRAGPIRGQQWLDHPDRAPVAGTRAGGRAVTGPGSEHQSTFSDDVTEANPRWLVTLGAILLVGMLLAAAFALGVYFAERNLL